MTNTWLFQAHPKKFDIDAYLKTNPSTFLWLVTRYDNQMEIGDKVFIWRSNAGTSNGGGVIAKTEIIEQPKIQPEDVGSLPFWINGDPQKAEMRVRLRTIRTATSREVIQRSWCLDDPILQDMLILKTANATNFLLSAEQADRLEKLWTKVGIDFNYAESVAALWVYSETYQKPLSRLPGSQVADVALQIGRAVSGVYNKVMNFRHLDPRDAREGFGSVASIDRTVWNKFFDPINNLLKTDLLNSEFQHLWHAPKQDSAEAIDAAVEREARKLVALPLSTLLEDYNRTKSASKPTTSLAQTTRFERDPRVVAIAKKRADFKCEVPDCKHLTFLDRDENVYCETHHIEFLAAGGDDTPENTACLCPAHHREAHSGVAASQIRALLLTVRGNAEGG